MEESWAQEDGTKRRWSLYDGRLIARQLMLWIARPFRGSGGTWLANILGAALINGAKSCEVFVALLETDIPVPLQCTITHQPTHSNQPTHTGT